MRQSEITHIAGARRMTRGTATNHGDSSVVPLPREVLEEFPQLRDKAVIDVVNGMEVVGDHLRTRDENPGSMTSRVWDLITGEAARRQQAQDRSVEVVLKGVNGWLIALQTAQVRSDVAIARVAEHLRETRQFVMKLEAKHQQLQENVAAIKRQLDEHIERTDKQLSELRKALCLEGAERRAWNAVERVKSRWESGRFDAFPPFLRAVLAANDLYWSDFGAFLRLNGRDEHDAAKLCEHARDTFAALTHNFAPGEKQGPAAIEDWLAPLAATGISADRRDVAVYLLEDSPCDIQPLAASAAARLRGPDEALADNLPRLMLPKYLGDFAVREVESRITAETSTGEG